MTNGFGRYGNYRTAIDAVAAAHRSYRDELETDKLYPGTASYAARNLANTIELILDQVNSRAIAIAFQVPGFAAQVEGVAE